MFKLFIIMFFLLGAYGNVLADTSNAVKGKELYRSYGCALCHGWEGRGDGINSRKFLPPPTNFHKPQAYLHGRDSDSIRRSVQYGIREDSSIMPAFEYIPPDEMDWIIAYLRSLQENDAQ